MEAQMTNMQFTGVINMIKALIKRDTPKEELIEYLDQLTQDDKKVIKGATGKEEE